MLQDKLAYTDDLEQVHKAERIVLMTPSNDSNRTYVPEFTRAWDFYRPNPREKRTHEPTAAS